MRSKRDAAFAGATVAVRGLITLVLLAAVVALVATSVWRGPRAAAARSSKTLVASIRAEPRSFNRYTARDLTTEVITFLTQSALVRVDRASGRLAGELAESWDLLPDELTYRVRLRRAVRFSDGTPFTADDVVFSFRALYDEGGGSELADSVKVHNQPLSVTSEDAATVLIRFPAAFAPGLRLLDGVPMLSRQRLEQPLREGRFATAWSTSTPPSELAGLGPFVLHQYDAGQRLVFDRNPFYWGRDGDSQLPALDHVILEIVKDQDTELLRLAAGEIDLTQSELRPLDLGPLTRAVSAGRLKVSDLGVGLDGDLFWLNLTRAKAADARARWLQDVNFRRAVAHAVDRHAFVDTVYFGSAVPASGVVSPGNAMWHEDAPAPAYDPAAARALLAGLQLADRDRDGTLEDSGGRPVRFTLLTQGGNTSLERGASVLRDSLGRVGVRVDIVPFDAPTLVRRMVSGDYDGAYFRLLTTDTDPSLNLDFWLSSGSAHVWNLSQPTPATKWEADVDELMQQISSSLDPHVRRTAFAQVQRIMAGELPVMTFAFPRLSMAMSSRVGHATPAVFRPPVLWNPAGLTVDDGGR